MRIKTNYVWLCIVLLVFSFSNVCAAGAVSIDADSISVNGMTYDAAVGKTILYKDTMNFSLATIHGKAVSSEGRIVKVEVSLDKGKTWKKAELNRSGSFDFRFRLDENSQHTAFIRATDSQGSQNDLNQIPVHIVVSSESLRGLIESRLSEMIKSYCNKNSFDFMHYVSPEFANREALELALRRDYSALSRMDINTSIINLAGDGKGNVAVVFKYQRNVLSSHSGQMVHDTGLAEVTFKLTNQGPLLWKMRAPLMFGLSGNDELRSGVLRASENSQVLVINPMNGLVQKKDINSIASGSDYSSVQVRTVVVPSGSWLNLADGTVSGSGDIYVYYANSYYSLYTAGTHILFGKINDFSNINQITSVPMYSSHQYTTTSWDGTHPLAIYNSSTGKYSVIERLMFSEISSTLKWKYQPDGSNLF